MGIINWKMIITVIIILGIIALVLSTSPAMADFFDKIFSRFSGFAPERDVDRNVSFILTTDEYIDLKFNNQNVNIIISSDLFNAKLSSGNIETSKNVSVYGLSISGYVTGKHIFFEGDFSKIETDGTEINLNAGTITANSTFNSLVIENLELDELEVPRASGTIIGTDTMSTLGYKGVNITYPLARFEFNDQMHIEGVASKITAESFVVGHPE